MYSDTINLMWLSIWGNSLLAGIALIIVFSYFCYQRNLDLAKGATVIIPVVFGLVLDGSFPRWIQGIILVGIGFLWGLLILRVAGLRG